MPGGFEPDSRICSETKPSPNFDERITDSHIEQIVLHYTGMPDSDAALEWLCNESSQVSCHYFIYEDGRIIQLVQERNRAWHAGASYWKGNTDINSSSIGIEIANPGHEHGYKKFPKAQIESVVSLSTEICNRRKISPNNVLAHSDVAPDRKQDPGEFFPWDVLASAGIGIWQSAVAIREGNKLRIGDKGTRVARLQALLQQYGFKIAVDGEFDERTKYSVAAFQSRYRQQMVDGVADVSTVESLANILALQKK